MCVGYIELLSKVKAITHFIPGRLFFYVIGSLL